MTFVSATYCCHSIDPHLLSMVLMSQAANAGRTRPFCRANDGQQWGQTRPLDMAVHRSSMRMIATCRFIWLAYLYITLTCHCILLWTHLRMYLLQLARREQNNILKIIYAVPMSQYHLLVDIALLRVFEKRFVILAISPFFAFLHFFTFLQFLFGFL